MNWQAAWQNDHGEPDPAFSSAIKAGSSEAVIEVYRLLMDVLGAQGMLQRGSSQAQYFKETSRTNTAAGKLIPLAVAWQK